MKKEEKISYKKINETISLTNKILKILFFLVIIVGVYASILVLRQLGIINLFHNFIDLILRFLKIIMPFFIGIIIAWLFDPLVKKISSYEKINRVGATIIVYAVLITIIYLFFSSAVPLFVKQINEFVSIIPNIIGNSQQFVESTLNNLRVIDGLDVDTLIKNVYSSIETFGNSLTTDLPNLAVNFVKALFSTFGIVGLGLIIGFYMLFDFDHISEVLISFFPKKIRKDVEGLFTKVNSTLRLFVQGILTVSTIVFLVSSLGFAVVGLEAALLFGLFCGITNVIPYAGPYIGGVPAAIVGFSQSTTTGLLVILVIAIVQMIEGNILQPLVMGKTMKLHPVTIIIGLLVFGNLFGIVGMILATPILSILKILYHFFKERIDIKKINIFK